MLVFDLRPICMAMTGSLLLSADVIQRRRDSFSEELTGTVRVSTAELVAQFLSAHLSELKATLPEVEWELAVSHVQANLTRREADLLIRECLPDSSSLVSRKLGKAAYAIYGARDYVERFPQRSASLPASGSDMMKRMPTLRGRSGSTNAVTGFLRPEPTVSSCWKPCSKAVVSVFCRVLLLILIHACSGFHRLFQSLSSISGCWCIAICCARHVSARPST